jgi:acyl carrier protein
VPEPRDLAAVTPAEGADDPVAAQILALVVEQTGYPPEMLDLDLDLEADLGIDTVKQAELFVAVRETYGIERDDTLQLRDYPTLAHVIGFVRERAPQLAAPGARRGRRRRPPRTSQPPRHPSTPSGSPAGCRSRSCARRSSACVPTGVALDGTPGSWSSPTTAASPTPSPSGSRSTARPCCG